MTQLTIVTTPTNSGDGTPLATAFNYCNSNFNELYSRAQTTPPPTLVGSVGDQAGMYAYDSAYFYYCFANYTGNTTVWAQVTQVGNISVNQIQNGTSNVFVNPSSNVTVSINGTPNIAVFTPAGAIITGTLTTDGNIQGGNILTVGQVSSAGNVTGNYILGNGSQLTGIAASYSDSNVTSLLSAFGSNTISTTGNITSGYLFGNGSQLTGIAASYGNADVAAYLPTYTGNLSAGNISVTGNIYIGNTPFTRTLTVGTRTTAVSVPLASNNSFNVLTRTGNVSVLTT
jgi:hypothetical protein